jgi:hypothetical protein
LFDVCQNHTATPLDKKSVPLFERDTCRISLMFHRET